MFEWLLGPKRDEGDSLVTSLYTASHIASKELESLNKSLTIANKEFNEEYSSAAVLYKRFDFEGPYLAVLLSIRKLMGVCESHIKRTRDLYSMSMRSGSKPFGRHDVFYHLFDPVQSLTRGLVLALTCLTMMRADGIKGDFSELVSAAERFAKLVKAIVYYDKDYRKGDRREDIKAMSKFIDVIKADSDEILKLAKKANKNKLKIEALQDAKVANREY